MNKYKPEERLMDILNKRPRRSTVNKKEKENKHQKRSTDKATKSRHPRNSNSNNSTVKFYSTVDELNEGLYYIFIS